MSTPMKPTLDQRRATHAWEAVDGFLKATADPKARAKYAVHARKLPVRIIASGLGQALAFLLAKNYCPDLLKSLGDWVLSKRSDPPKTLAKPVAPDSLLLDVIKGDSEFLQLATAETLAYLRWHIRFVEAKKSELLPSGTDADEVT